MFKTKFSVVDADAIAYFSDSPPDPIIEKPITLELDYSSFKDSSSDFSTECELLEVLESQDSQAPPKACK